MTAASPSSVSEVEYSPGVPPRALISEDIMSSVGRKAICSTGMANRCSGTPSFVLGAAAASSMAGNDWLPWPSGSCVPVGRGMF